MTDLTRPASPAVHFDKRTALDPDDFVRKLADSYAGDPRGFRFWIVDRGTKTKTGRVRFTLAVSIDDPHYFDRKTGG